MGAQATAATIEVDDIPDRYLSVPPERTNRRWKVLERGLLLSVFGSGGRQGPPGGGGLGPPGAPGCLLELPGNHR